MPLTRNQQAALVQQGQSSAAATTTSRTNTSNSTTKEVVESTTTVQSPPSLVDEERNVTTDNKESGIAAKARQSQTADANLAGSVAARQQDASLTAAASGDWSAFQASNTSGLDNDVFLTSHHHPHDHHADANNHVFDHAMHHLSSSSFYPQHGETSQHSDMDSFINDTSNHQQNAVAVSDSQRQSLFQQHQQENSNQRRIPTTAAQDSAEENLMATLQSHIDQFSPQRSFNNRASPSNAAPRSSSYNMAAAAATAAAISANAAAAAAAAAVHGRQRSDSTLSTAFSTPNMSRIHSPHDHSRNFSLESMDAMTVAEAKDMQQRPSLGHYGTAVNSVDSSSLSMDLDSGTTNGGGGGGAMHAAANRHLRTAASAAVKRHSGGASTDVSAEGAPRTRNVDRHNRSLGQMGAAISAGGVEDGLLRLGGNTIRPLAPNFDRFGMHHASSARSLSPPEPGTIGFPGNFSPHSSISTMRNAGDSSIDTSTDSISNSATTMSGVPSQASSVSEEMMIGASGSKRLPKIKTRLRNIDRKAICEAARDDPKIRQEDLALRFGIERSTVSKTLKNKEKWLAIEEESNGAMIMKHRLGKFPQLEEHLANWITKEVGTNAPILDATIKERALQVAKDLGISLDQFKASVGWIDKFRERHRLRKVNAHVSEGVMDNLPATLPPSVANTEANRHRARAFHSGMALALQQQQQHHQGILHDGNPQTGDSTSSSDVSMFYTDSPVGNGGVSGGGGLVPTSAPSFNVPHSSTPQRPRSASDEGVLAGIHETPKASKRHYDDMVNAVVAARSNASINSSMENMRIPADSPLHPQHQLHQHGQNATIHHAGAHMHEKHHLHRQQQQQLQPQTPSQQLTLTGTSSANEAMISQRLDHDDSGYAIPMSDNLTVSTPSISAASKRRKGVVDASKSANTSGEAAALSALREQIRRTRSEQFFGATSDANGGEAGTTGGGGAIHPQQSQVAAAAVAAAQEIRRSEHLQSMMIAQQQQQRNLLQQQQQQQGGRHDDGSRRNGDSSDSAMNNSSASSPADQMSFMRAMQLRAMSGSTAQAALYAPQGGGHASPSAFIGTPPRSDLSAGGAMQHPQQARHLGSPSVGTPVPGDDRPVTLDEARESLDVVLAFISRQPATLSPSDYFVLGNLQGQLNALANPYQNGHETPVQPCTPMHPAHALAIGGGEDMSHSGSGGGGGGGGLSSGIRSAHPGNEEALSRHPNELNLLGITPGELSMVGELSQHRGAHPSSA